MIEISIIVPIYNVEKYLPDCIDSILSQTFSNFELLLINDGSPDKCGKICDYYATIDNRIKVIHKPNGGVSSARNVGIDVAKGEYIGFIDPDDTVDSNMYEVLLKAAKNHDADMVICPIKYINVTHNTESISSVWKDVNCLIDKVKIEKEIIPTLLSGKILSLVSSVNKLYKKSVLDKYKIRFNEKKHHSEDALLNYTLITLLNKIVFIDTPFYNYFIRQRDSLTQIFREDLYNYASDNKKHLINLCKKYNVEIHIETLRNHFTNVILAHMQEVANKRISISKKRKIISEILSDDDFINDLKIYKCPSSYYKVLRSLCLKKKEDLFIKIVKAKSLIQSYLHKVG